MNAQRVAAAARSATTLGTGSRRDRITGHVFLGFLLLSLAVGLVTLGALVVDVLIDGVPKLGKQLLLNPPSVNPEKAGARPAILASLYLGVLIIAFSVPLGVGTAVYLEEYARKDRWHAGYFQFGSVVLPSGHGPRETICFSGQAVEGIDGRALIAELQSSSNSFM